MKKAPHAEHHFSVNGLDYYTQTRAHDQHGFTIEHMLIEQETGDIHHIEYDPFRLMDTSEVRMLADMGFPHANTRALQPWNLQDLEVAWLVHTTPTATHGVSARVWLCVLLALTGAVVAIKAV